MASVATCAVEEKLDLPLPQHPEFRSRMRALRREVGIREACETASAVKNILLAEPVVQEAGSIAVYAATDGEVDVSDAARWAQEAGKRVFFPAMREDRIAESDLASLTAARPSVALPMREDRIAESDLASLTAARPSAALPMREDRGAETDAAAGSDAAAYSDAGISARTRLRIAFVEWLPDADWTEGAFGIPEPAGGEETAIENCDAALVPGVAFGKDGSRIGRGKGFYDRALAFLSESSRPRPPVLFGICHDFQIIEGLDCSPLAATNSDIPMDAVVSPAGIHWSPGRNPLAQLMQKR